MRVENIAIKSPADSEFEDVPNPQESPLNKHFPSPGAIMVKVKGSDTPPAEFFTVATMVKGAKWVTMRLRDENGAVTEERKVTI